MKRTCTLIPKAAFSPAALFLATALVSFIYTLMEWVFIVTKPSFLQQAALSSKLLVLATSSALLAVLSLALLSPYFIAHAIAKSGRVTAILRLLALAVPALMLASLVLMMVDNFTYTVFNFGIVSTTGVFRAVYALLFIILAAWLFIRLVGVVNFIQEALDNRPARTRKWTLSVTATLISLLILLPAAIFTLTKSAPAGKTSRISAAHYPHIILITADSLNANRMSVYGYGEETTPFLEELASSSLVAQNAFSNAQGTIGSLTSILTGRYPVDVRVLTTLDILRGEDATRHLPGILRSYGYYSAQLSYSYYADAHRLNFLSGFDEANGTKLEANPVFSTLTSIFPSNISYFMSEITTRLLDRLGHIFFLRDMNNPFLQVTESPEKFNDQQKLDYALSLLDEVDQPLFVHIHWMGTHGPTYHLEQQVFSAGENPETQGKFDDDFYQDSILEFDRSVEAFYGELKERGLLDNTMLVIAADHSQHWNIIRLPLIMRFPQSAHKGTITGNVQYLDIAPTILDALAIPRQDWMAGVSLLSGKADPSPILLTEIPTFVTDPKTGKRVFPEVVPPFYQFGKISEIHCDQWIKLEFATQKLTRGTIPDYTNGCNAPDLSDQQAMELLIQHLETYGFDASSLVDITNAQ